MLLLSHAQKLVQIFIYMYIVLSWWLEEAKKRGFEKKEGETWIEFIKRVNCDYGTDFVL